MDFLFIVIILVVMLALIIFSAYGLARRVTDAFKPYGKSWAVVAGSVAFAVSFFLFSFATALVFGAAFGR
ncbi:MAG: hypothetical protein JWO89_1398 [Verrucomicrobiaceae bacterium]|nr:hypothetical protein [Verrucomicrobiaceae bacterium]